MVEPKVGAAALFPVVFFDGDREVDLGPVAVDPSLGFNKLQVAISELIGLAPHQISTSLVRRKKARPSPDVRRKVPLDEGSDLAALARERDCFLLVMLRVSRRERRGRARRRREAPAPSPERTILRRSVVAPPDSPPWDYEGQLRELQRQKERYLMNMAPYHPYTAAASLTWPGLGAEPAQPRGPLPECAACSAKDGAAPPFHWCVRDAITVGFRSPAGPIQRPSKMRVEAST